LAPGQFPSVPLVTDLPARGTRTARVENYGHLKKLVLTGDVASNGGSWINSDLARIWKEAFLAKLMYYPRIFGGTSGNQESP